MVYNAKGIINWMDKDEIQTNFKLRPWVRGLLDRIAEIYMVGNNTAAISMMILQFSKLNVQDKKKSVAEFNRIVIEMNLGEIDDNVDSLLENLANDAAKKKRKNGRNSAESGQ